MIKYFHQNYMANRKTYAVEIPTKNDLLDLFAFGNKKINVKVGVSTVHPKDNYNKKTGRSISTLAMKEMTFQLKLAHFVDDDIISVYLYSDCDLELQFRIHRKSENVYLLTASGR